MLKLSHISKKLLIVIAFATAIYGIVYGTHRVEAASVGGIFGDVLKDNDGWGIKQEKDKLTDEIVIRAYKKYPIDGGRVEVVVNCTSEDNPLVGIFEHVDFDFTIFSNNIVFPKKFNSSFNGKNTVPFEYRLDAGKVKKWESESEYNNFVRVGFAKKEHLDKFTSLFPVLKALPPPILQDLLKSETLRVRLPVYRESPVDISIQLSYLKYFFDNCSASKDVSNNKSDKDIVNEDHSVAMEAIKTMEQSGNNTKTQSPTCNNSKKSTLEILICSDEELLYLDNQLNIDYRHIIQNESDAGKIILKAEQIAWNKSRSKICDIQPKEQINESESRIIISCLKDMYKRRLGELEVK